MIKMADIALNHDAYLFHHPMPPDVALGRAAIKLPFWLRTIPRDGLAPLGQMDKAIATYEDKKLPKQLMFKDKSRLFAVVAPRRVNIQI